MEPAIDGSGKVYIPNDANHQSLASLQLFRALRLGRNLFQRALAFRDAHTRVIDLKEEFYDFFTPKNSAKPEIHGGFALAHWNGSRAVEEQVKNDLKVTIRCIPFDDPANPPQPGRCVISGEPSARRVLWAKSY